MSDPNRIAFNKFWARAMRRARADDQTVVVTREDLWDAWNVAFRAGRKQALREVENLSR